MYFRCLASAMTIVMSTSFSLLLQPSPRPPKDWEERVTPGFDPSIERLVVRDRDLDLTLTAAWHQWGEDAVDALIRLLYDEPWHEMHRDIIRVLAESPYPSAAEWMHNTARELVPRDDLSPLEADICRDLIELGLKNDSDRFSAFCMEAGGDVALIAVVRHLLDRNTLADHARAEEAFARVRDAELRARYKSTVAYALGYARANEPMHPDNVNTVEIEETSTDAEAPVRRVLPIFKPARATLAGRVTDTDCNPLDGWARVYYENTYYSRGKIESGAFHLKWLPPDPFVVQFVSPWHQSRLLVSGRDFSRGDTNLCIQLKRGIYDDAMPVWMQAAGFKTPEEALEWPELGELARKSESYYQRMADYKPWIPPKEPPAHVRTRLLTTRGKPVRQITVQPVRNAVRGNSAFTIQTAVPVQESVAETLESTTGEYTVPNPCLLSAEGHALQLVNLQEQEPDDSPFELKMQLPAALIILAQDYHGRPVEGAGAALAVDWWEYYLEALTSSSTADRRGRIRIDNMPDGRYWYMVYHEDTQDDSRGAKLISRLVQADLKAGEKMVVRVTLPVGMPGTTEGLLCDWQTRYKRGLGPRSPVIDEIAALEDREAMRMGELVCAELEQMPRVLELNQETAVFFSNLVPLLGSHTADAKKSLQRMLMDARQGPDPSILGLYWPMVFLRALTSVGDLGDMVFWSELINNPDAMPLARLCGSVALGLIGTEKSVNKWLALRDAARQAPGAKVATDLSTHAQKMRDSLRFAQTLYQDTTGGVIHISPSEKAWVDKDYTYGSLNAIRFQRFGDEWLITGVR